MKSYKITIVVGMDTDLPDSVVKGMEFIPQTTIFRAAKGKHFTEGTDDPRKLCVWNQFRNTKVEEVDREDEKDIFPVDEC